MKLKIKLMSILDSTEDYICQQNNCISVKPHGLSSKLPTNPYESRRAIGNRNLAVPEDRGIPGTVELLEPNIICMYAQYGMGKPFRYNNSKKELCDHDTFEQRLEWFKECLDKLDAFTGTFAMPFGIGCGLAGGDWGKYCDALEKSSVADRIVLYKIPV